MKTVISFFALILFTVSAHAQASFELTCRAKAKEIAATTYSSCVTEARTTRIEEVRANYQKELAALKSKYDKELKKMASGQGSSAKAAKTSIASEVQMNRTSKGLAKQLPSKANNRIDATPVQTATEGTKVVAVGTDQSSDSIEKEASDSNQVETADTTVVPAE